MPRIDDAPLAPAVAPPRKPPASHTYYPALDGIRAVAFLMVFGTHYLDLPWGFTGVNVFFVLSGFLITGILYDTRDKANRAYNFYVRRTLRIFPLYYGVMLALILVYPLFHWQWSWAWLAWPAYLGNMLRFFPPSASMTPLADAQPLSRTFPHVQLYFGHFWSLCVEEQFYLVWPWVVFWIKDRRSLLRLCAAGIVVIPLLRVAAVHLLPQYATASLAQITATPFPFDALLIGGFVALLRRGPWAARTLPLARIGLVLCTGAFLFWLGLHHASYARPYPGGAFTYGMCFVDLIAACLIVMALEAGSVTFKIFDLAPLRWLGRISYGAYVFHDIFHKVFRDFMVSHSTHVRSGTAALAFVFTLLAAWASLRWFESPFIRLKDRLTRRAFSGPTAISAA